MRQYLILIFLGFSFSFGVASPKAFTVKEDLQKEWKKFQDGKYLPYTEQDQTNTIYFFIDAEKFSGDYLRISSPHEFALFVNGKLASLTQTNFNIDSLSKKFSATSLLIAVHQKNISSTTLKITIETPLATTSISWQPENKPQTFFRDFVVIASMVLLVMLIVVTRLNPKLASDYFS